MYKQLLDKAASSATRSASDTVIVDRKTIDQWHMPGFQRPLKNNAKTQQLIDDMKANGGVIPGDIILGFVRNTTELFIVDGQHRIHCWKESGLDTGYADIRVKCFDDFASMAYEFVKVQQDLVPMRVDDTLRALEFAAPLLKTIRNKCPFVGYSNVRMTDSQTRLSMSVALRCWAGSASTKPINIHYSAAKMAESITEPEVQQLTKFLNLAFKAWGTDKTANRLWGSLNLTICAWLYRNIVISRFSTKTVPMSADMFTKCLMSLGANAVYCDWLIGRNMAERDRSPAYDRIKKIFQARVKQETGKVYMMPSPDWLNS